MNSTNSHREFYARLIVNRAGSGNERLIDAFATVERERFVGPGPWRVFTGAGYISTITDDPKVLYQDILVGLASDRGINNGEPSLHARAIAACAPKPGEQVVHVGAGTGYYTAVLAHMVAPVGRVVGYEIEADLAGRASSNLAGLNATVAVASGTDGSLPPADVIYVSAGATHPVRTWLEALNPGGRLLFPLTPDKAVGVMLLIERGSGSSLRPR
jgi:protein-L-isoaspartate(D-aspartate) O-methyltransferase